jgi:hypothetical protein
MEALNKLSATPSFREGMAAQRRVAAMLGGVGSPLGTLSEEDDDQGQVEDLPNFALRAGPRQASQLKPP